MSADVICSSFTTKLYLSELAIVLVAIAVFQMARTLLYYYCYCNYFALHKMNCVTVHPILTVLLGDVSALSCTYPMPLPIAH